MKLHALEAVAKALQSAGVRYLVAGGLAVNAHGYLRYTGDIDLVIALDEWNVLDAFSALAQAGYRPSVPVTASEFASADQRNRWRAEKHMEVLSFFCDRYPETPVDVFVHEPFAFDAEFKAALVADLLPGLPVRYVSIPTLIRMKKVAGRPRDQDDIQHLRWILEEAERNG